GFPVRGDPGGARKQKFLDHRAVGIPPVRLFRFRLEAWDRDRVCQRVLACYFSRHKSLAFLHSYAVTALTFPRRNGIHQEKESTFVCRAYRNLAALQPHKIPAYKIPSAKRLLKLSDIDSVRFD